MRRGRVVHAAVVEVGLGHRVRGGAGASIPGARVVTGQVIADRLAADAGAACTSVTVRSDMVTLPVLVTRNE